MHELLSVTYSEDTAVTHLYILVDFVVHHIGSQCGSIQYENTYSSRDAPIYINVGQYR